MKRRTFVISTVLSPIALAACGSSDNHSSDTATIPQPDPKPDPQPTPDPKPDPTPTPDPTPDPVPDPTPVDEFWDDSAVQKIIKSIRLPSFPNQDFYVTTFGAIGDGKFDCFNAFADAIAACNAAGGGRVVVPSGTYLVNGPITLLSNVNLHLLSDKTLVLFGTDPKFYPNVLTHFEANPCYNYSPLLYAYQANNIAVTGKGTFDGQASTTAWWPWKGAAANGYIATDPNPIISGNQAAESDALKNSADTETYVPWAQRVLGNTPTFGPNAGTGKMSFLRPNFVGFWGCQVVQIDGVTFNRSPMWQIAPVLCSEVTVTNVTVESLGPNNDGCDPVCCSLVLMDNCTFNTGDDCIAIKSGRGGDGFNFTADGKGGPRPSHDIVIQNCKMAKGHGGVTLGSEISGGVYNVYAQNIVMSSTDLYASLRLKTNSGIGGYIRNIYMRNIQVPAGTSTSNNLYGAILIDGNYNGFGSPQQKGGCVRNYLIQDIMVSDFNCGPSNVPVFINLFTQDLSGAVVNGVTQSCTIKNIKLRNATFGKTARDPAGVAPVGYDYGKSSGVKNGTTKLVPPSDLPYLQVPALIGVTVNGTDQSNASN